MLSTLSKNWWVFAVRGIFAIIFGVLALIWPGLTLLTLVLMFGVYALVDGFFAVVAGVKSYGTSERWWIVLLGGIVGIIVGILTFFWPDATALVILYFIAAWALVTGILDIIAAIQLRKVITNEWSMGLAGLASAIFGILLFLFPGAGALSVVWIIGIYAIIAGILFIILGFRLRSQPARTETGTASHS